MEGEKWKRGRSRKIKVIEQPIESHELESDLNLIENDEQCALVGTVQNDPGSYRG